MITPDTKVQNAVTMVVEREDHTLGNMLRMCPRPRPFAARPPVVAIALNPFMCTPSPFHVLSLFLAKWYCLGAAPSVHSRYDPCTCFSCRQLLEDRDVLFSGYRVPHPLEPAIQVKVQTGSEIPGPTQAVEAALGSLLGELKTFEERFRVRWHCTRLECPMRCANPCIFFLHSNMHHQIFFLHSNMHHQICMSS